jgi:hypothetical protein
MSVGAMQFILVMKEASQYHALFLLPDMADPLFI